MSKSKFFVIGTEGSTTDGRNIERSWLEQAARNYSPAKYNARINLEHFKGILPDSPFKRYGDVVALKTEERDGKMVLLAQIDPTADLLALSKSRQKIHTSMEIDPDFADTGEAYLVGLAVTDDPASLGTDMLKFCAGASVNPLASRKLEPGNVFSAALAAQIELEDEQQQPDQQAAGTQFLTAFLRMLAGNAQAPAGQVAPAVPPQPTPTEPPVQAAADNSALVQLAQSQAQALDQLASLAKNVQQTDARLQALTQRLEQTPTGSERPTATGGDGGYQQQF